MGNPGLLLWGKPLHLFRHLLLEGTACTQSEFSAPSNGLDPWHLNWSKWRIPILSLSLSSLSLPYSSYYTVFIGSMVNPSSLYSSPPQMDFPNGWFYGNVFLYPQLPYVLVSKTAWQLFSNNNIFSPTLQNKAILFIDLKSHHGVPP